MTAPINREFGRQPYLDVRKGSEGNYVEEMRKATDSGANYQAAEGISYGGTVIKYSIPQSEFKKPYQTPDYKAMEHYVQPENPPHPTPPPIPNPVPVPTPTPTPTPVPGPTPGPTPKPTPPPGWKCKGCWGPLDTVFFCRNGPAVPIKPVLTCPDDPIVSTTVTGIDPSNPDASSGSGGKNYYQPGDVDSATIEWTTKSGLSCKGFLVAKPKDQCPQDCAGAPPLTMSVTTTTMAPGNTQGIVITGGQGTLTLDATDPGGVIQNISNTSITIKNGVSNPDCVNNPTITVRDKCGQTVSIKIGITTGHESEWAIQTIWGSCLQARDQGMCGGGYYKRYISCDGSVHDFFSSCATALIYPCPDPPPYDAAWAQACSDAATQCSNIDIRTQTMKDEGCCPGVAG